MEATTCPWSEATTDLLERYPQNRERSSPWRLQRMFLWNLQLQRNDTFSHAEKGIVFDMNQLKNLLD
jgi:hypothetical protein